MRRRNSLLEALLAFKALDPRISVNDIVAFLYTCENEGLSVQELAFIAEFSQTTASRCLRALGRSGSAWSLPPALGFVDAYADAADGRTHVIRLSNDGERFRARLDEIIRRAAPIAMDQRRL